MIDYEHEIEVDVEVVVPLRLRVGIEDESWGVIHASRRGERVSLEKLAVEQCAGEIDEAVAAEIERLCEDDDEEDE